MSFSDGQVRLWQIDTGEILKSIEFNNEVCCLKALKEDLIAICTFNKKIIIYDLTQSSIIKSISPHSSDVEMFYLLSNGNLLSGSTNGEIKLLEMLDWFTNSLFNILKDESNEIIFNFFLI